MATTWRRVAPRTGAWIETTPASHEARGLKSPPARGRGLKHYLFCAAAIEGKSPPARGRGLKHYLFCAAAIEGKSPPARGRGLKLDGRGRRIGEPASPPARGRGLKLRFDHDMLAIIRVAPRTGAWIETRGCRAPGGAAQRRPPHGGVD